MAHKVVVLVSTEQTQFVPKGMKYTAVFHVAGDPNSVLHNPLHMAVTYTWEKDGKITDNGNCEPDVAERAIKFFRDECHMEERPYDPKA